MGTIKISPEDYEKKIPIFLFNVYKNLDKWKDSAISMNIFTDKEKAIEVIKSWMLRGGSTLSCFNSDYSVLIISKTDESEKYIASKTKAKEEQQKSRGWYEKK